MAFACDRYNGYRIEWVFCQSDPDLNPDFLFLKNMQDLYSNQWLTAINVKSDNKLRCYANFKTEFKLENYLLMLPAKSRRSLTKLRISNHNLAIETGRYTKPKTTPDERKCPFCYMNFIEDEYHFLLVCPFYITEREHLINNFTFLDLSDIHSHESFCTLMSCMDFDVCTTLCKYVHECFEKRKPFIIKEGGMFKSTSDLITHVEFLRLGHIRLY